MKTTILVTALLVAGAVQTVTQMDQHPSEFWNRAPAQAETVDLESEPIVNIEGDPTLLTTDEKIELVGTGLTAAADVNATQNAEVDVTVDGAGNKVDVEVAQQQIITINQKIEVLQESEVSREDFVEVQADLVKVEESVEALKAENAELEQRVVSLETNKVEVEKKIIELEENLESTKKEVTKELIVLNEGLKIVDEGLKITTDLSKLNAEEIIELRAKLEAVVNGEEEIDEAQSIQINALIAQVTVIETKLASIDTINNDLSENRQHIESNTTQIAAINIDVESNKEAIANLVSQISEATMAIAKLEGRIGANEERIANHDQIIEELKAANVLAAEERAELRDISNTTLCMVQHTYDVLTTQLSELIANQQVFSNNLNIMLQLSLFNASNTNNMFPMGQMNTPDLALIQSMGMGSNVYGQGVLSNQLSGMSSFFGTGNTVSFAGPVYFGSPGGSFSNDMLYLQGGSPQAFVQPANPSEAIGNNISNEALFNYMDIPGYSVNKFGSASIIDPGFAFNNFGS